MNTNEVRIEIFETIVINGEETDYQVSDYGRIRNRFTHRYLTPVKNKHSRIYTIAIRHRGLIYNKSIAVWVALTFLEAPIGDINDYRVNFKDGDRDNWYVKNLQWVLKTSVIEDIRKVEALKKKREYDKIIAKNEENGDSEPEVFKRLIFNGIRTNYKISNYGKIINTYTGQELKPNNTDRSVRTFYSLRIDGVSYRKLLVRWIAIAFLPLPNGDTDYSKYEADHIDGDPTHDHLHNIQWMLKKDNNDKMVYVENKVHRGEYNGQAKLTENIVRNILDDTRRGMSVTEMSEKYNVNKNTITSIRTGNSWNYITKHYNLSKHVKTHSPHQSYSDELKEAIRNMFRANIKTPCKKVCEEFNLPHDTKTIALVSRLKDDVWTEQGRTGSKKRGGNNTHSKLSEAVVRGVLEDTLQGASISELADKYDLDKKKIRKIRCGYLMKEIYDQYPMDTIVKRKGKATHYSKECLDQIRSILNDNIDTPFRDICDAVGLEYNQKSINRINACKIELKKSLKEDENSPIQN